MYNNENKSMCSQCGGRCCKRFAGAYKYSELGIGYRERLGKDLAVGVNILLNPAVVYSQLAQMRNNASMDFMERVNKDLALWNAMFKDSTNFSEFAFFVKPKQSGDKYAITTQSALKDMGSCVNLGTSGCNLDFDSRPFGCKVLIPNFLNGKDNCQNDVDNCDLLVYRSWHREHGFLEKYVLDYIAGNDEIRKDKFYVENIIGPLQERYGSI